MIRAIQVHAAGSWSEPAADCVVLEFDDRHRRRTVMSGVHGLAFLLDLREAVMLRGGDAVELEDGRLVEIVAAPEPLVEIKGRSPADLVRLAWHIGNRHLPAQITASGLRIRQDHVIEKMLKGLGAKLVQIEAPFDPEGGAYAGGSHDHVAEHKDATQDGHKHGDHHGHKHDHDRKHGHDHGHGHKHDHGHKHGHKH